VCRLKDTLVRSVDTAAADAGRPRVSQVREWRSRLWWAAICVVAGVGVLGLIRVWASDRGFWNDELYIAINIKTKSFRALAGPLRYGQVAPPGWLMGEHAIYKLFGGGEQLLKLPQLLASIIVVVLTAVIACRSIGRWAAVAATLLVVLNPTLQYYAGELKQYAVEAAAALIVVLAAEVLGRAALRGRITRRIAVSTGLAFLIAVSVSYSSLIVVAGATAGLMVAVGAAARKWRGLLPVLSVAAPALAYGVFQVLRRERFSFLSNQDDFFPNGLPPHDSGLIDRAFWLPRMWRGFTASPMFWRLSFVALLLVAGGVVALVLRGRLLWAGVLAGPVLGAVGAAAVGKYPMEDRVALYLVAPVVLMAVAGVDGLARWARQAMRRKDVGTAALLATLLAAASGLAVAAQPAAAAAVDEVRHPLYRDNVREVFSDVAARIQPGDVVLVYDFSQPPAHWYGERFHLPIVGLIGLGSECDRGEPLLDKVLGGAKRVWYVRGQRLSKHPENYHAHILAALAKRGRLVASQTYGPGTILNSPPGWTVVDLTAGPDPNPPHPSPITDRGAVCPVITPDYW
jgi:hypothetical protein